MAERDKRLSWNEAEKPIGGAESSSSWNPMQTVKLPPNAPTPAPLPFVSAPVPMPPVPPPPMRAPAPSAPFIPPPNGFAQPNQAPAMVRPPADSVFVGAGGALAASNAAAGVQANVAAPLPMAARMPAPAEAPSRTTAPEMLELLFFEPVALPRIRRHLGWKKIIAELKPRSSDEDFDGGLPPDKRREPQDRRDIFGVLARGTTVDAEGIQKAITEAVADDGTFVPPFVLCAGELEFPFDEVESLKATIAALTPLVTGDKKLKEALDTANELLKTPWLQSAGHMAEGMNHRLKEAFAQGYRSLPPHYLHEHTTRILLEQRHYQKRTVMGREWIRSLFKPGVDSVAIPAYLPDSLSKELPMFERFRVRMMVEARGQVDQYESHAIALRVVAVGRVFSGVRTSDINKQRGG